MDVIGAFVGVHRLEVHQVPDHLKLVGYAIGATHVARRARNLQRLAAAIARLMSDTISAHARPASVRRPTRNTASNPSAISPGSLKFTVL